MTPKVFVIGGGMVARVLARGLREAGVTVLGLWARRAQGARDAATAAGVQAFDSLPAELAEADCVILAVSDASIAAVAHMLVQGNHLGSHAVLLHCAGSQSSAESFTGIASSLAGRGLLHPLRAIASGDLEGGLAGTYFGIEGDPVGRAMAAALCASLGGRALMLEAEQMAGYHAAAALASNYLVALMDLAGQLLESTGLKSEQFQDALCDLASGAISNLQERGSPEALTGPIRRGDRPTVERHLHAIADNLPAGLPLYRAAALWSVPMAAEIGDATDAQLSEIKDILS